jgi:hypothetical protein
MPASHVQIEETARESSIDGAAELRASLRRLILLADACDRCLRDPDNPERYDIGRRAKEESGMCSDAAGVLQSRHADPRELLIQVSAELRAHVTALSEIPEPDPQPAEHGRPSLTISAA